MKRNLAVLLAACLATPLSLFSQAPADTAARERFDHMAQELHVGGPFLFYMDFHGDMSGFADFCNQAYNEFLAANPNQMPIPINFHLVLETLGLIGIEGLGVSSMKLEEGLFENNIVLGLSSQPKGLLRLGGVQARPFNVTREAPADADLVGQFHLDGVALRDAVSELLTSVMGPMGKGLLDQQLNQPAGPLPMTINEAIEMLSTRVSVVMRTEEGAPLIRDAAGQPLMVKFDGWLKIDGAGPILDGLAPMFAQLDTVTTLATGERTYYQFDQISDELPYAPVLMHNVETGNLLIATSLESLTDMTAPAQTLADSPQFQKVSRGLSNSGLSLWYTSEHYTRASLQPMLEILQQDPETQAFAELAANLLENLMGPNISVAELTPVGLKTTSRNPVSYKTSLAAVPIAVAGIGAAVAVPAFGKVRAQAKETAVMNNLRMIASAGQRYILETGESQVSYGELIEAGYFMDLEPVAGEDYTGLTIELETSEISVELSTGEIVTYEF